MATLAGMVSTARGMTAGKEGRQVTVVKDVVSPPCATPLLPPQGAVRAEDSHWPALQV
jgi:hypothetical protein